MRQNFKTSIYTLITLVALPILSNACSASPTPRKGASEGSMWSRAVPEAAARNSDSGTPVQQPNIAPATDAIDELEAEIRKTDTDARVLDHDLQRTEEEDLALERDLAVEEELALERTLEEELSLLDEAKCGRLQDLGIPERYRKHYKKRCREILGEGLALDAELGIDDVVAEEERLLFCREGQFVERRCGREVFRDWNPHTRRGSICNPGFEGWVQGDCNGGGLEEIIDEEFIIRDTISICFAEANEGVLHDLRVRRSEFDRLVDEARLFDDPEFDRLGADRRIADHDIVEDILSDEAKLGRLRDLPGIFKEGRCGRHDECTPDSPSDVCDDRNPCTNDHCHFDEGATIGKCHHTPANDGTVTVPNDPCVASACCHDGVLEKTELQCAAGTVCAPLIGGKCTPGEGCMYGQAVTGTPCADDGLFCTEDFCVKGECGHWVSTEDCDQSTQSCYSACPINSDAPQCVDLSSNADNCGECGIACGTGVNALLPKCCAGGCVNTDTDNFNCGACGNVCLPNVPVCTGGVCSADDVP